MIVEVNQEIIITVAIIFQINLVSNFANIKSVQLSSAVSASVEPAAESKNDLARRLKIGGLFSLWFALNIGYNIYNKKVLN